jgi:hypothetical protein
MGRAARHAKGDSGSKRVRYLLRSRLRDFAAVLSPRLFELCS